jgi:HPt (histidine-containing phosphotransfer) domain-containing protein
MSNPNAPMLDFDNALSRAGGDMELLKEIAALFIDDYPRSLAELHQALAAGDAQTVNHAAHGLKGAVANFGAQPAVAAAFTLEQMGRTRDLTAAPEIMADLQIALAKLREELERLP